MAIRACYGCEERVGCHAYCLRYIEEKQQSAVEAERCRQFAECLQERSEWYEKMATETDEEYANEKLRREAERCSGMEIEYLYEAEIMAARKKHAEECW